MKIQKRRLKQKIFLFGLFGYLTTWVFIYLAMCFPWLLTIFLNHLLLIKYYLDYFIIWPVRFSTMSLFGNLAIWLFGYFRICSKSELGVGKKLGNVLFDYFLTWLTWLFGYFVEKLTIYLEVKESCHLESWYLKSNSYGDYKFGTNMDTWN